MERAVEVSPVDPSEVLEEVVVEEEVVVAAGKSEALKVVDPVSELVDPEELKFLVLEKVVPLSCLPEFEPPTTLSVLEV